MVRNCDGAATTAFCSLGKVIFAPKESALTDIVASTPPASRFKSPRKVIAVPCASSAGFIILVCPGGSGIWRGMRQWPAMLGDSERSASIEPALTAHAAYKIPGVVRWGLREAMGAVGHVSPGKWRRGPAHARKLRHRAGPFVLPARLRSLPGRAAPVRAGAWRRVPRRTALRAPCASSRPRRGDMQGNGGRTRDWSRLHSRQNGPP